MVSNKMEVHQNASEPWIVTVVDTGEHTMTGGRIKRVARYLGKEDFCLTYGDGLSDVNLTGLIKFHKQHGRLATMTAVQPPGRFGMLNIEGNEIKKFVEKPEGDGGFINGGFFVLNPNVVEFIKDDSTLWEREPLEALAQKGQLQAYHHRGFWQPMDTLRDKNLLEDLWRKGQAPWQVDQ
jgi:glucose-1-phosphate cytidylyltransferase